VSRDGRHGTTSELGGKCRGLTMDEPMKGWDDSHIHWPDRAPTDLNAYLKDSYLVPTFGHSNIF
jgi:hypothetical protein